MTSLATVAELRVFLGDPDLDDAEAEIFLDIASGEVVAYAGQNFAEVTDEEIIIDGTGTSVILLPGVPTTDVLDVAEGLEGERTSLPGPADIDAAEWEWSSDGIIRRISGLWVRRFRYYAVTYSHGYASIPADVKGVVLRLAARSIANPEGMRSETLGRYSYTLAGDSAGVGLYAPERRALDLYVVPGGRPTPVGISGSGS